MPVVRVLVEAQVRHQHELVAHRVPHGTQRDLHHAVGVPGSASLGVLVRGHAEEDQGGDPQRDEPLGLHHQRVDGVLDLARHRGDRDGRVRALAHEERCHQVVHPETRPRPPAGAGPASGATGAAGAPETRPHRRSVWRRARSVSTSAIGASLGAGRLPGRRSGRPARRRSPGPKTPRPRGHRRDRRHAPRRRWSGRCTPRAREPVRPRPSGVRSATKACTEDDAVNVIASAVSTRASSSGAGAASGTVRYASTRVDLPSLGTQTPPRRCPARGRHTGTARAANPTRRSRGRSPPAPARCAPPARDRARRPGGAGRRRWPARPRRRAPAPGRGRPAPRP